MEAGPEMERLSSAGRRRRRTEASEFARERFGDEVWAGIEGKEIEAAWDGSSTAGEGDEAIDIGRDISGMIADDVGVDVDVGGSVSSESSKKTPESRS